MTVIVAIILMVLAVTSPCGPRPRQQKLARVSLHGTQVITGVPRGLEERKALIHEVGSRFFRRTVFRKHPFEPVWIALLRGFIAFLAITGISLYALNLLVVLPIVESEFLPIRASTGLPQWQIWDLSTVPGRHDSIVYDRPVLSDVAFVFGEMIPNSGGIPSDRMPPFPQDFVPVPEGTIYSATVTTMDGLTVTCPNSSIIAGLEGYISPSRYPVLNCSQADPQMVTQYIQLVVDYSNVNQSSFRSDINFYTIQASSLSSDDSTYTFFRDMVPSMHAFPMVKGAHLRGTTVFGGRRLIKKSWKDVLGVGADYTDFSTYTHGNFITVAQFSGNVSTLLLSPAVDFTNFVIQEDYRQHTTLAGLASIGGVFTVADGIFAMLFGTPLFSLILGSKAISPFGVLGILIWRKLRSAIRQQYPALGVEIEQGGMATFLHDVAVELDILDDGPDQDGRPSEALYAKVSPRRSVSPTVPSQGGYELNSLFDNPSSHDLWMAATPPLFTEILLEPSHARRREPRRVANFSIDSFTRS
ncbi:hypothetical protein JAAARDRAFT_77775 [Jaapia argillacea MUCL 33604]|uniref:Uncharacterized protein n=1 Tax=Jaapia argillacea MUCL 33604 TaxID=933084 RepID=A0A067Q127_9AGAM|nr:hypothetical protein JAAARDRAFT_77775 [Jaapia argillacea MUCL 33604]